MNGLTFARCEVNDIDPIPAKEYWTRAGFGFGHASCLQAAGLKTPVCIERHDSTGSPLNACDDDRIRFIRMWGIRLGPLEAVEIELTEKLNLINSQTLTVTLPDWSSWSRYGADCVSCLRERRRKGRTFSVTRRHRFPNQGTENLEPARIHLLPERVEQHQVEQDLQRVAVIKA